MSLLTSISPSLCCLHLMKALLLMGLSGCCVGLVTEGAMVCLNWRFAEVCSDGLWGGSENEC